MPKSKSKKFFLKKYMNKWVVMGLVAIFIFSALRLSSFLAPAQINLVTDSRGVSGEKPRPLPTATCTPRPPCLDEIPRCYVAEPVNGFCASNQPTQKPGGIQSFTATNPCGLSNYLNIRYTCKNGKAVNLLNRCTSIRQAMSEAKVTCEEI